MYSELFHIYGPLSIHSYGLIILIGLLTILFLMARNQQCKKLLTTQQLLDAVVVSIFAGIIGGRFLFVVCNWYELESPIDVISVWDGGLSLMGSILGISFCLPIYLRYNKIPVLEFLSIICLYVPLLQSIGRIGCFFAGCCYGIPTILPWGVINCHYPEIGLVHPTQLYSSFILFLIFLFMQFYVRRWYVNPLSIISWYFMLTGLERFFVDFFRGDREFFINNYLSFFSVHQFVALSLFFAGLILFFVARKNSRYSHEHI